MDKTQLIAELVKMRKVRGWRQVDLASALGVPQSKLSAMEAGSAPLKLATLLQWVDALDCKLALEPLSNEEWASKRGDI